MNGFLLFDLADGHLVDRSHSSQPYLARTWSRRDVSLSDATGTHYGFVVSGVVDVDDASGTMTVFGGMYFSVIGEARIVPRGDAPGLVLSKSRYRGLRMMGGPFEERGRLRYIDGCSDTALIPPARLGDPCLNHLHMPAGVRQRSHHHPSDRVGLIARGGGQCKLPQSDMKIPLSPGVGWLIEEGVVHSFDTDEPDGSSLDVIAWHPDSDSGPTDDDHPMLNRTLTDNGKAVRGVRS